MAVSTRSMLNPFSSSLVRFYFLYFGVLGIYIPFFNLYCRELGFSGFEIGIISIIQPLSRLVFPVFWGMYADRRQNHETLIRSCYFLAIVVFSFFLFVKQFQGMVLVLAVYTFFIIPVLPLWEATVLERLNDLKKDYGEVRLWGSLGFIFFSLLVGIILDITGAQIVIPCMLFLSALNLWCGSGLIMTRPSISALAPVRFSVLKDRKLLLFLVACALMHMSHGTYYGFFSIFMREMGHSNVYIGLLWTLGVIFEIGVMIYAGRWIRRFGHERLFALTFMAAVLRWGLSAWVASGPCFIFIQALHGLTFGLFHVCAVTWVARLLPKGLATTAQSLYSSATYGLGGMIGFFVNGCLYESWGAKGLWLLDIGIAASGFVISLFFILKKVND